MLIDCDIYLTRVTIYAQLPMLDGDNVRIIPADFGCDDNVLCHHSCSIRNNGLSDGMLYMSESTGQQAKLVRGALQTYVVKSYGKQRNGSTAQSSSVTMLISFAFLGMIVLIPSCVFWLLLLLGGVICT